MSAALDLALLNQAFHSQEHEAHSKPLHKHRTVSSDTAESTNLQDTKGMQLPGNTPGPFHVAGTGCPCARTERDGTKPSNKKREKEA